MEPIEGAIVIPQKAELVTQDVVDVWYATLEDMADRVLEQRKEEGAEMSEGERGREKHSLMLQYCAALDTISDQVRQQVLNHIYREHLNEYAPEGWSGLREVIQEAAPSYAHGAQYQLQVIAETVAPFCEKHGIAVHQNPADLWKINEAATYMRGIINGDAPEQEKVSRVRQMLDFASTHTQAEVKAHCRQYRGDPGRGVQVELSDGTTGLLLIGPGDTIEAARQRIGNLVTWQHTGRESSHAGELRQSKARPDQLVQDIWDGIEMYTLRIVNTEGEIVQEVG